MSNFLLIHGASHGAWCWAAVAELLEAAGHTAFALDLPGHGADLTPRKDVTFAAYVSAANALIRQQGIESVTVVGHSLAGIILPQIALENPGVVNWLVFLAALVLNKGERAIDLIPEERAQAYLRMAAKSPEGCLKVEFPIARQMYFNDLSDPDALTAYSKLTPQPLAVYLQEADYDLRDIRTMSRYLFCTDDRALPRSLTDRCAAKLGVIAEPMQSGHCVMLSNAEKLCQLLLSGKPQ